MSSLRRIVPRCTLRVRCGYAGWWVPGEDVCVCGGGLTSEWGSDEHATGQELHGWEGKGAGGSALKTTKPWLWQDDRLGAMSGVCALVFVCCIDLHLARAYLERGGCAGLVTETVVYVHLRAHRVRFRRPEVVLRRTMCDPTQRKKERNRLFVFLSQNLH